VVLNPIASIPEQKTFIEKSKEDLIEEKRLLKEAILKTKNEITEKMKDGIPVI
jgi:chromosome segregation ATPase